MDIQTVDTHPRDMHILHTVHRRRAPVPLHRDIMELQIQTVRRADHIATRPIRRPRLLARRIEPDNIRHLHIVRTPNVDHRILEPRIVQLRRIRHKIEPADMRIVTLAPEHRAILIRRRIQHHIAALKVVMCRRQHRIAARKMRIHRLRRRLMTVIRRHKRTDLKTARIRPVIRKRRSQKPVHRMQQQLIAGF